MKWHISTPKSPNYNDIHSNKEHSFSNEIKKIIWSPCNTFIVFATCASAKIFKIKENKIDKKLKEYHHTGMFLLLCLSPSKKNIALSSGDEIFNENDLGIQLWNTKTDTFKKIITQKEASLSIASHPCESIIATGNDERIQLWNIKTGKKLKTLTGHDDRVWCVVFSPCGEYIASGSDDKTIRLWEIKTGKCIQVIKSNKKIHSVTWSPCRKHLAFAGHVIRLFGPGIHNSPLEANTHKTNFADVYFNFKP